VVFGNCISYIPIQHIDACHLSKLSNVQVNGSALRFGIVGFGKLAEEFYLPAFRRSKVARIVGIADPLAVRREKATSAIPSVRTYSSHNELCSHESLEGILVSTPPSSHLKIWTDLRSQGIPIFIEKPFVLPGQLSQIVSRKEEHSLVMVNFNRRLWPMYQSVREIVNSGQIGEVEAAEFRFFVDVRPWISVTEHRLWPSEGGVLYDLGSHVLDLIHFMFGREPIRIQAEYLSGQLERNQVMLSVELHGGSTIRAHVGYNRHNQESILLHGSKGGIRIPDANMTIHFLKNGQPTASLISTVKDWMMLAYRAWRREESMFRYTIHASLAVFVNAVRSGGPFVPSLEDAIRNALWLEAAHQSLQAGKPMLVQDIKAQSMSPA
jgi:predicted dehydrogenase